MDRSKAVRLAVSCVLALAAGGAAWLRVAPIEPFLDVVLEPSLVNDAQAVFSIIVTARGGETIDEIRIEPVSGPVHVIGEASFKGKDATGLPAGGSTGFGVELDDPRTSRGVVRVVQKGRVERTYELTLETRR
jgi:hypothetical protein